MFRIVRLELRSAVIIGGTMGLILSLVIGILGILIIYPTYYLMNNPYVANWTLKELISDSLLLLIAGVIGGAFAGAITGLVYNFVAKFQGGLRVQAVFEDEKIKRTE